MKTLTAKPYAQVACTLGEGVQLFPSGRIRFVDIPQGNVFRLDGTVAILENSFEHEVSKALPAENGQVVLGRDQILFLDDSGQLQSQLSLNLSVSNLRCSDGCVLPDGSLLIGIVERNLQEKAGSLVRVNNQGILSEVLSGATIPNGVAVMPENKSVIWVDSPTQTLVLFSILDDFSLGSAETYFEIPKEHGVPDGLTVDSEGGIWVAMWGGGRVIRVSPEKEIDHIVEVSCRNVTSCAFDAVGNLLITTAMAALTEEEALAGAGDVWFVDHSEVGFSGLESHIALVRHS